MTERIDALLREEGRFEPPAEFLAGTRVELVEHVRRVLGPIAAPAELEFSTKLPKTRSGKIMRRVLKAQELGVDPGDVSTIEE